MTTTATTGTTTTVAYLWWKEKGVLERIADGIAKRYAATFERLRNQ